MENRGEDGELVVEVSKGRDSDKPSNERMSEALREGGNNSNVAPGERQAHGDNDNPPPKKAPPRPSRWKPRPPAPPDTTPPVNSARATSASTDRLHRPNTTTTTTVNNNKKKVYIPPARRKRLQQQQQQQREEEAGEVQAAEDVERSRQYESWQAQCRQIYGCINRLSVDNIKPMIIQTLQNVNLLRMRGVFVQSLLKALRTSVPYIPLYCSYVAVLHSKLPILGEVLVSRLLLDLRRAYQRRDRAHVTAVALTLGHLHVHGVVHEIVILQLATLLLQSTDHATQDGLHIAVQLIPVVGASLQRVSPSGLRAMVDQLRAILAQTRDLHPQMQQSIQRVLEMRQAQAKTGQGFPDHPLDKRLDLVDQDSQVTLELDLDLEDDELEPQYEVNDFRFVRENFDKQEEEWQAIRNEVLGLDDDSDDEEDDDDEDGDEETDDGEEEEDEGGDPEAGDAGALVVAGNTADAKGNSSSLVPVQDMTEADLVHLRRTIYLTIMSSLSFEECVHKLAQINIPEGREEELVNMLLECCAQERTFLRYYGMIAARFCLMADRWREAFTTAFGQQYQTIHRLETNKLRNVAKLFAHLLHTYSLPWSVWQHVEMAEDTTTSSSRIFCKIVLQEVAQAMGMQALQEAFQREEHKEWYAGLFPMRNNLRATRYAINFLTSIGLGPLTDDMREYLKTGPKDVPQPPPDTNDLANDDDASSVLSSSSESSLESSSLSSGSESSLSSRPRRKRRRRDSYSDDDSYDSGYSRRRRSRRRSRRDDDSDIDSRDGSRRRSRGKRQNGSLRDSRGKHDEGAKAKEEQGLRKEDGDVIPNEQSKGDPEKQQSRIPDEENDGEHRRSSRKDKDDDVSDRWRRSRRYDSEDDEFGRSRRSGRRKDDSRERRRRDEDDRPQKKEETEEQESLQGGRSGNKTRTDRDDDDDRRRSKRDEEDERYDRRRSKRNEEDERYDQRRSKRNEEDGDRRRRSRQDESDDARRGSKRRDRSNDGRRDRGSSDQDDQPDNATDKEASKGEDEKTRRSGRTDEDEEYRHRSKRGGGENDVRRRHSRDDSSDDEFGRTKHRDRDEENRGKGRSGVVGDQPDEGAGEKREGDTGAVRDEQELSRKSGRADEEDDEFGRSRRFREDRRWSRGRENDDAVVGVKAEGDTADAATGTSSRGDQKRKPGRDDADDRRDSGDDDEVNEGRGRRRRSRRDDSDDEYDGQSRRRDRRGRRRRDDDDYSDSGRRDDRRNRRREDGEKRHRSVDRERTSGKWEEDDNHERVQKRRRAGDGVED